MRWEDERYVRVYTRDTADWVALSWEARAAFVLLLRVADRAGIIPLGKKGMRGLATMLHMPAEVLDRAVLELCEDGSVTCDGHRVLIPNFIEAQEAKSSDAQRKRDQRERAREKALDEFGPTQPPECSSDLSRTVTKSHNVTDAVTRGHTESHAVTPSLAVPSLAVPSCTEPAVPKEPENKKADAPASRRPSAQEQFFEWVQAQRHEQGLKLERERPAKALNAMLRPPVESVGLDGAKARYRAYLARSWGRDKDPPWPLEGFVKSWDKLRPVENTNELFDAYEPEAPHVR